MTAAELREALEQWNVEGFLRPRYIERLASAARLWLRILEGDEQLVEKVAKTMAERPGGVDWYELHKSSQTFYREDARAVLAALAEGEKK